MTKIAAALLPIRLEVTSHGNAGGLNVIEPLDARMTLGDGHGGTVGILLQNAQFKSVARELSCQSLESFATSVWGSQNEKTDGSLRWLESFPTTLAPGNQQYDAEVRG